MPSYDPREYAEWAKTRAAAWKSIVPHGFHEDGEPVYHVRDLFTKWWKDARLLIDSAEAGTMPHAEALARLIKLVEEIWALNQFAQQHIVDFKSAPEGVDE